MLETGRSTTTRAQFSPVGRSQLESLQGRGRGAWSRGRPGLLLWRSLALEAEHQFGAHRAGSSGRACGDGDPLAPVERGQQHGLDFLESLTVTSLRLPAASLTAGLPSLVARALAFRASGLMLAVSGARMVQLACTSRRARACRGRGAAGASAVPASGPAS